MENILLKVCEFCNNKFEVLINNFFCNNCNKLNAVGTNINYFDYLSLQPQYPVNLPTLEKQYIKLFALYHSDNFVTKNSKEQLNAVNHSVYLNEAYRTLKDDVKLVAYLYKTLTKQDIIASNSTLQQFDIINYFFELNDELDHINNNEHQQAYINKIDNLYHELKHNLQVSFNRQEYQEIKNNLYIKLIYLHKIQQRLKS